MHTTVLQASRTTHAPPVNQRRAGEGFNWRTRAACIGLPPEAFLGTDHSAARVALAACADCPVREQCLSVVDPEHHWFDGVSGGRVWRNGRDVTASAVREGAK